MLFRSLKLCVGLAAAVSFTASTAPPVSSRDTGRPVRSPRWGSNTQLNYNNGTIKGDIGLGSPRQFTISNASLTGNIRFSGAADATGLSGGPVPGAGPYTVSGGGTVSGGVIANDSAVANALNYVNDLSQALGGNAGTNTTIASGGSINASAGTLGTTTLVDGNALGLPRFNVTSANFPNGIIRSTAADGSGGLEHRVQRQPHGQILLAGGITLGQRDHQHVRETRWTSTPTAGHLRHVPRPGR